MMKRRKFRFAEPRDAQSFSVDDELNVKTAGAPQAMPILLRQEPSMALRDEIIFLLHTAAEIEHALMAQYLYSAYSLPSVGNQADWKAKLISIAKEEMGHLLSVQNILLSMGGTLNFEREDYPYNEFYPFPFVLEPFSVKSVARYVLAEMPEAKEIPDSTEFDADQLRLDAEIDEDGIPVTRVGALFALLLKLVRVATPETLMRNPELFQGKPSVWRAAFHGLIVDRVSSIEEIAALIEEIAEQGEGASEPKDGRPSHFQRLYQIYLSARALRTQMDGGTLANALPRNPTLHDTTSSGFLENREAFVWGDIFNHRMRWLLASVVTHLQLPEGQQRGVLSQWALADMIMLSRIAEFLVTIPQHNPPKMDKDGRHLLAGPPFELPYSLNLPDQPRALWRHQEMMVIHSMNQLRNIPNPNSLSFQLQLTDQERASYLKTILDATS